MSRSNPTDNTPNPSTRWFEWKGGKDDGYIEYWDKDLAPAKKGDKPGGRVKVPDGFTFLVLDELSCVRGWSNQVGGIYSNEIRDSRSEVLVVKAFKGGVIANGLYAAIKDHVTSKAIGGKFTVNCYIAYKDGKEWKIGSMMFHGASLNAWIEFRKANRKAVIEKALQIKGFKEDVNGGIKFRVPCFYVCETTPETDAIAKGLDVELQTYLKGYLSRTKTDQAAPDAAAQADAPAGSEVQPDPEPQPDSPPDGWQPGEPSDNDLPV